MVLSIVAIIMAALKFYKLTIIPSVINVLIIFYDIINISSVAEGIGKLDIGGILSAFASIVVIAGSVLSFVWKLSRKQ